MEDHVELALPLLLGRRAFWRSRLNTFSTSTMASSTSEPMAIAMPTMLKVDELANALQVCLDSGAKKVLLPITSAADLGLVPADLIGCFNLVFYQSAEDAVYKALGVE